MNFIPRDKDPTISPDPESYSENQRPHYHFPIG